MLTSQDKCWQQRQFEWAGGKGFVKWGLGYRTRMVMSTWSGQLLWHSVHWVRYLDIPYEYFAHSYHLLKRVCSHTSKTSHSVTFISLFDLIHWTYESEHWLRNSMVKQKKTACLSIATDMTSGHYYACNGVNIVIMQAPLGLRGIKCSLSHLYVTICTNIYTACS